MLRLAREGVIEAITGETLRLDAQSICVHGDNPAAVAIARHLAQSLRGGGITLAASGA